MYSYLLLLLYLQDEATICYYLLLEDFQKWRKPVFSTAWLHRATYPPQYTLAVVFEKPPTGNIEPPKPTTQATPVIQLREEHLGIINHHNFYIIFLMPLS